MDREDIHHRLFQVVVNTPPHAHGRNDGIEVVVKKNE